MKKLLCIIVCVLAAVFTTGCIIDPPTKPNDLFPLEGEITGIEAPATMVQGQFYTLTVNIKSEEGNEQKIPFEVRVPHYFESGNYYIKASTSPSWFEENPKESNTIFVFVSWDYSDGSMTMDPYEIRLSAKTDILLKPGIKSVNLWIQNKGWKSLLVTAISGDGKSMNYSVDYPGEWIVEIDSNNQKSLNFIADGLQYSLKFKTGSSGGPSDYDEIKEELVTFQGKKFNKKSWIKNSQPIFISYIVMNYPAPFEAITATIPSRNWQEYVVLYQKVLGTLKY